MNIHYEVEIGLERSPLTGDKIVNDFGDLSAGISAIILYALMTKNVLIGKQGHKESLQLNR